MSVALSLDDEFEFVQKDSRVTDAHSNCLLGKNTFLHTLGESFDAQLEFFGVLFYFIVTVSKCVRMKEHILQVTLFSAQLIFFFFFSEFVLFHS